MAVLWFNGAVHYQQIPIMNTGSCHGVSTHPEKEGGCPVSHKIGIEVERGFRVFIRGRREPRGDAMQQQGQEAELGVGSSRRQCRQRGPGTAGGQRNYYSHGEQLFLDTSHYKAGVSETTIETCWKMSERASR